MGEGGFWEVGIDFSVFGVGHGSSVDFEFVDELDNTSDSNFTLKRGGGSLAIYSRQNKINCSLFSLFFLSVCVYNLIEKINTQLAFTCSKLTIEKL